VVFRWCYSGVTVVLQWRNGGVTGEMEPGLEHAEAMLHGITMVLQWCYNSVTVVLQWCYGGVTVVSQWCYVGVAVVSRWCYSFVTSHVEPGL
jgi:hypothetical protein